MPSDLFNQFAVNNSGNGQNVNKFGISHDDFTKKIYQNYDSYTNSVNRILEVSFGIVYDLYHKWIDIKSKNPKEWESIIKSVQQIDDLDFNDGISLTHNVKDKIWKREESSNEISFRQYVKYIITYAQTNDVGLIFSDNKEYLETISLLRKELLDNYDSSIMSGTNFVKIDVGATHNEFPFAKAIPLHSSIHSSFAFKVVPHLSRIFRLTSDTSSENIMPVFDYTVFVDINRLIYSIIDFYDPTDLPESVSEGENNKEVYITNGMVRFKNCPEFFTRKIILELFDNYHNVYGNWSAFVDKFKVSADKIYRDSDIVNITTKLSHFNMSIPSLAYNSPFDEFFPSSNDLETLDLSSYDKIYESLYYFSSTLDEKDLALTLVCKAFKSFFSTGACFNFYYEQDGTADNLKVYNYTKEFFAKYDRNVLLDKTTKITDYNIRDFFQAIIKENNGVQSKPYQLKLDNNENAYFLFCKLRRNVWVDIATETLCEVKLIKQIKICCSKVEGSEKVFKLIQDRLTRCIQNSISQIFTCDNYDKTSWNKKAYAIVSLTRTDNLIKFISRVYERASNLNYVDHSIISGTQLGRQYNKDSISEYEPYIIGEFASYESDQARYNNIITKMKESGLIPLIVQDY